MTAKTPSSTGREMGNRVTWRPHRRTIAFAIAAAAIVLCLLAYIIYRIQTAPLPDDGRQIRNWLAAQNNQAQAFAGLSGPIYFDETQTLPEPSRVGRCVEGRLVSASIQLAVVPNPALTFTIILSTRN